jgi:hypothetical protein
MRLSAPRRVLADTQHRPGRKVAVGVARVAEAPEVDVQATLGKIRGIAALHDELVLAEPNTNLAMQLWCRVCRRLLLGSPPVLS